MRTRGAGLVALAGSGLALAACSAGLAAGPVPVRPATVLARSSSPAFLSLEGRDRPGTVVVPGRRGRLPPR